MNPANHVSSWLALLVLCASLGLGTAACSDNDTPAVDTDPGNNNADAGDDGCQDQNDCADGRLCIEGVCEDCLADEECTNASAGDTCQDGECCQSGTEGCGCGSGCGDDLACQDGVCQPCPEGTEGCGCGPDDRCDDGLGCQEDTCQPCPAGTEGCPCDAMACGDGLVCQDDTCVDDAPPECGDLDCAEQGRVCNEDPEPSCGPCDVMRGFIDDGQGGCMALEGDECQSDDDCQAPQRCLRLAAGRRPICVEVPACVEPQPEGEEGAAWSPLEGGCVACPSCDGVEGSTGAIWPTTSAAGDCLCETNDGFYYDVASAADRPRPCDSDGDGWTQQSARQYVQSNDIALSTNARCAVERFTSVALVNERSERRLLSVSADLNIPDGFLDLYEANLTDEQTAIDNNAFMPTWGERKPDAAMLNPLTKLCVSASADYNANGVSDLSEHDGSEVSDDWMIPFLGLAHFAELHTINFDAADGGVLTIAEARRCEPDNFALGYDDDSEHWRECQRRRDGDYRPGQPGFDLGRWSCDAASGSCPSIDPEERADGDQITGACSGPALDGTFTGMNHHSQFQCVQFVTSPNEARQLPLRRLGLDFDVNLCQLGQEDGVECEQTADVTNGQVGWAALRTLSDVNNYARGCQRECRDLVSLCEGFTDGPDNGVGCESDVENFGALVCNGCPQSGTPCDTGELGVCAQGTFGCDGQGQDAVAVCRLDVLPDALGEDRYNDGRDDNCDGFDGRLSDSIFVDVALGAEVGSGQPDDPFGTMAQAFIFATQNLGTWRVYVAGQSQTLTQPLVVPSSVIEIRGAMARGQLDARDWQDADFEHTALTIQNPLGWSVTGRNENLVISRFDVAVVLSEDDNQTLNGRTVVGMRVDSGGATVTLEDFDLLAGPGDDGQPGAAFENAALSGEHGQSGQHGCQIAAGFCGLECPDAYWTSGRGGACTCGGGSDCAGGDGGAGGTVLSGCDAPMDSEAPLAGQSGDGGATGGAASLVITNCDDESGDNVPENSVGSDGDDGTTPNFVPQPGEGFYSLGLGWVGRAGLPGQPGTNGGGGGGGGGGRGAGTEVGGCPNRGGHGGGGGAGGCGGNGGNGGGTGGGSIAAFVVSGQLELIRAALEASDGGDGGEGGAGQQGGAGGLGLNDGNTQDEERLAGHPYSAALQDNATNGGRGGDGGNGGDGTAGSPGAGGPSIAVLLGPGGNLIDGPESTKTCAAPGVGPGTAQDGDDARENDCERAVETLVQCEQDIDCGPSMFCDNQRTCQPKLANGELCQSDALCASGLCLNDACAAPLGAGQACAEDRACAAGPCTDGVCRQSCVDDPECGQGAYCEDNLCEPQLDNGQECTDRDQCLSSFCPASGPQENRCTTPCDNHDDCTGQTYCQINVCSPLGAAGDTCDENAACTSGACSLGRCLECNEDSDCDDGFCDIGGACQPLLDNGTVCGRDGVCRSGVCDVTCTECANNDDCGANQYCDIIVGDQNSCENRRGEGGQCDSNQECRDGLSCALGQCRRECSNDNNCNGDEFCNLGGCFDKLPNGDACVENRVCQTNICDVTCTECVNNGNCSANQYCEIVVGGQNSCENRRGVGGQCDSNQECNSGLLCSFGTCKTQCSRDSNCNSDEFCNAGVCDDKVPNGSVCVEDRVCQSDICNGVVCRQCEVGRGCNSNQFCNGDGNCQTKLGNGSVCVENRVCSSGICNGVVCRECRIGQGCDSDEFCNGDGACQNTLGNGSACVEDRVCSSGICNGVVCRQCEVGRGCNSNQFCNGSGSCQGKLGRGSVCVENRVCLSGRCNFPGFCD